MIKSIFIGCALAAIFTGCGKSNDAPPSANGQNLAESGDATVYNVQFEFPTQFAVASVKGNSLSVIYTEKVNLLVNPTEYGRAFSLHLTQDFSTAALAGFDFTTVTQYGDKTFNWVDDNLNNVILKGKTDTTVNGVKKLKIKVERDFTFTKVYDNTQLATAALNTFLVRKTDAIHYTAFYYNDKKELTPATGKDTVTYSTNTSGL